MKHVSLAAGLILMGGALAGCGGSDGAPTDASEGDFCNAYIEASTIGGEDATGKDLKDWAEDLEKTGTPESISDDERKGFELLVKWATDVDEDAKAADIEDPDMSESEEKNFDAFGEYVSTTCQDEIEKSMEDLMPEDAPSAPETE